ncbi:MAG: SDR family oxidoreductase, partial [Rickettsiales bacterium]|nr:SDR family oxidoreductase [Rickettsiales bacterium]
AFSDWQNVIDTNLSSVFYLSRIVAQSMASARSKGVIITMSSICAAGNAGQGAYAASKAGVAALTHSWAKELGGLGLRCVAIAPGFIDVASTRNALSEAHVKDIVARVPLKKLGSVHSVFQAVRYAIENDYVTGTVLEVDGGLTL